MSDFSVRSENVDVEQIMRQIRARIREKRGVDYTEEEIRELANVKLEKFIDPKGVRSGLLEEYRRVSTPEPPAPNFAFGEDTLYETHRGPIRWLRLLFRPFLKLLFNPNPLIQALHIQAELNTRNAERAARREQLDALHYELIHNLVVELTRTGVEVKSLKMRLESMASRLDFDERRARALEGVVQYRAGAVPPLQPPAAQPQGQRGPGPSVSGSVASGSAVSRDQPRGHQGPGTQGQGAQGPRDPGTENNSLDADGNERRARRRRRRGRRRPGDRIGGEGSPASAGGGSSAGFRGTGQLDAREGSFASVGGESPVESGTSQGPPPPAEPGQAQPSASAGTADAPTHGETSPKPPAGEGGPKPPAGEGGPKPPGGEGGPEPQRGEGG